MVRPIQWLKRVYFSIGYIVKSHIKDMYTYYSRYIHNIKTMFIFLIVYILIIYNNYNDLLTYLLT